MKIAIAGFHHETNTFAPSVAAYADFVSSGAWPGLTRGAEMFDVFQGMNLGIAGFMAEAGAKGHAFVPLCWSAAQPSGPVTEDAFERIAAMTVADLATSGPVDAVYLNLHGAMVTEQYEDGEGEYIHRVRAIVGPDVPIMVDLDLHANVTRKMVANATAMTAYRTYPHVDMEETGRRAARILMEMCMGAKKPAKGHWQAPYLIPLTAQCSLVEPTKGIYEKLAEIETRHGVTLSFTPGFPPADIAECGPAVFGYGPSQDAVDAAVQELSALIMAAEPAYAKLAILSPREGVEKALALGTSNRPVVLADTQDNPGAGGPSDTIGLLEALIAAKADRAVLALMHDPETTAQAHKAGIGATIPVKLGGRSIPGHHPYEGMATVKALGDGKFMGTGPMYRGANFDLGPMALIEIGGVGVIIGSKRQQPADQAIFRHLGVEPTQQKILGLKSSVHFRNDFQEMAEEVLVVAAPGVNLADPADQRFHKLRKGMRLRPQGAAFQGTSDGYRPADA